MARIRLVRAATMRPTIVSLELLRHRLAGLFVLAAHLYATDQAFRDLCDVHAICVRGVKRSRASGASILGAEYAAQQVRLEAALLQRLPPTDVAGLARAN
jgi:hypothetical protein